MRLLFIALRLPHQAHSGNALTLRNYLRDLGRRHEVDLVAFGEASDTGYGELSEWCARIEVVPDPSRLRRSVAKAAALLSGSPVLVGHYRSAALQRAAARLADERHYDAIVVQLYQAAQFRPHRFRGPVILDFEDPPAAKLARTAPWLGWRARLLARIDHRRLIGYERACVARFDRMVFVNRRDADEFARRYGCVEKTRFVPHAVAAGATDTRRVDGMVVMSGNMGHPPNAAAVEVFCRDVFPRVLRVVPEATLWIVGATPTAAVTAHGRGKAVTVTGRVPDVRSYLEQAMVAVCAVPVVVGVQTKILEAMASGTPVVTTSAGNYGIGAAPGGQLYVADDPEEFAARVIGLLKRDRWRELSEAGRRFVGERFSEDSAGAALEAVIGEAVAEHAKPDVARTA